MTRQTTLEVGDTRPPELVERERKLSSADVVPLVMCAHEFAPADVEGWFTHDPADVCREWIVENVEATILRLHGDDAFPHSTRSPAYIPDEELARFRAANQPETTQQTLVTDGGMDLESFGVDVPERETAPDGTAPDTSEDYKFSRPQCRALTADGDRCSNPVRRTEGNAEFCPRHHDTDCETIDDRLVTDGGVDREPGQVCPNPDCHIDQRFPGFWGHVCPHCATKLVVACSRCDSGAVTRDGNENPLCDDHTEQRVATDGGVDRPPVVFANAGTNNECLGCGGHVQPGTVRVYGTNDGRLYACPACSTPRDLRQGAGKDPDYDPAVDRGKSTASGYHPIFGGDGR